jgi:hypothetical protein
MHLTNRAQVTSTLLKRPDSDADCSHRGENPTQLLAHRANQERGKTSDVKIHLTPSPCRWTGSALPTRCYQPAAMYTSFWPFSSLESFSPQVLVTWVVPSLMCSRTVEAKMRRKPWPASASRRLRPSALQLQGPSRCPRSGDSYAERRDPPERTGR